MSRDYDSDAERITITVCGDGGCGKSSITLRLVRSEWTDEYDPTIEDSYSVNRLVDGRMFSLELIDTAGQEEYRGMWGASNLKSDAFLLVYDITNRESLNQLEYFTNMIEMEMEARSDNGELPPVMIVAGNKCDLQEKRQVRSVEGLEWARKRGCGFMETSARDKVNVEETFALLARRVAEQRRNKDSVLSSVIDLKMAQSNAYLPTPELPPPVTEKGVYGRTGTFKATYSAKIMRFWQKMKCW